MTISVVKNKTVIMLLALGMIMGQSCPSLAATPKWKFWQKNKQMEQPVPEENEENRQDSLWENLQPEIYKQKKHNHPLKLKYILLKSQGIIWLIHQKSCNL